MEKTKTTKFLGSFSLSKNGGGAGGTTNYEDLTNKPKVNGIVLSGNKTSADLGITTLTPFPSTWPTTGQFEDLLAAIRVDTIAIKGASFLGEVTFDDLPANLGNAEIKVEILEGTTSATKVIHSVITSGNRQPYRWEYTSWNSGNSNSGWISFQLPLTAGTGISIENNVISATGGADVPEDVYTQSNLLAGKGIEIVDEPVEGGIDNHTLACWHFDEDLKPIKFDSQLTSDVRGTIAQDYYKFGNGSCSGPDITIMNRGLNTSDFTVDYFFMPKDYLGGKDTYIGDVRIYINDLGVIIYFNNNNIYEFSLKQYGIWTHFAIRRKDLIYTIYVNGQSVFQSTEALTTRPATLFEALTGVNSNFYIDELRISDIARPLDENGKFPVPTKAYSLAISTGNKVINNTITKTSQLTNDSGFITDVPVATTSTLGGVKPDGTTITVTENGIISATGGSSAVDQTYGPTSTNAQSGTAVAEAVSTALKNTATGTNSLTILSSTPASGSNSINIGANSETNNKFSAVALGNQARCGGVVTIAVGGQANASADYSIAIGGYTFANGTDSIAIGTGTGRGCFASGNQSIQLGTGINSTAKTLQVWEHQLLDGNTGLIPPERLGTNYDATKTQVLKHVNGVLTWTVTSDNVTKIVKLTQAEYDQLETKDDSTFYAIVG